jgi:hypothetical protein
VASCFSASERKFINTNWKHQSRFFSKSFPILQNMIYFPCNARQAGHQNSRWKHDVGFIGQFEPTKSMYLGRRSAERKPNTAAVCAD